MRRTPLPILLCTSIQIVLLAAFAGPAIAAQATKPVAKQADNATLGKTILTSARGRTLYSLSAETKGRFICTGACASTWRPLVVPAGVEADRPGQARHDRATRRQDPGDLQGPPALQLLRRREERATSTARESRTSAPGTPRSPARPLPSLNHSPQPEPPYPYPDSSSGR